MKCLLSLFYFLVVSDRYGCNEDDTNRLSLEDFLEWKNKYRTTNFRLTSPIFVNSVNKVLLSKMNLIGDVMWAKMAT